MTTVTSSPSHSPRPFSNAPSPQFFYRAPSSATSASPQPSGALTSGSGSRSAPGRRRPYGANTASPSGVGRPSSPALLAQSTARNASSATNTVDSEKIETSSSSADVVTSSPPVAVGRHQDRVEGVRGGYVDSGTQYTPPGFPPTADRDLLRLRGYTPGPPTASALARLGESHRPTEQDQEMSDISGGSTSDFVSSGGSGLSGMEATENPERKEQVTVAAAGGEDVEMGDAPPESSQSFIYQNRRAATPSSLSSGSLLAPLSPLPPGRLRPEPIPSTWRVLPTDYMKCSPADLGRVIADMLAELIQINDEMPPKEELTRFHSRAPPTISVRDYLDRLIFHATLSQPILLAMVYYIDRLCLLYPAFTITSLTVHRFLITAATVAAKGLCDSFWTNHTYARVGGVSAKELAMLELEFLRRLDWSIVPPPEMLDDYYRSLVGRAEGYVLEGQEGTREGG